MEKLHRWEKDGYVVTTDKNKLDIMIIQQFLTKSIWAEGVDKETVKLSIENSLNFGLYKNTQQIGFARIVTDFTTFGYLSDVFILDDYRGLGLGRWLMTCCLEHPQIAQLRHIMLVTSMAPWLYEKMGYSPVNEENFVWQIVRPDIYTLWISRCIATARERIPGSIDNYVTGVSECSQQRGNLKDDGYILHSAPNSGINRFILCA